MVMGRLGFIDASLVLVMLSSSARKPKPNSTAKLSQTSVCQFLEIPNLASEALAWRVMAEDYSTTE